MGPRSSLRARVLTLRNVNWLGDLSLADVGRGGLRLHVRVRSSQAPQPATLYSSNGVMSVLLHEGEHGVASGQACVFYADGSDRSRVLGGGWIASARLVSASASPHEISALPPDRPSAAVGAVTECSNQELSEERRSS